MTALPAGRAARVRRTARPIVAGLLVAAALPPWGFWPLAFVGIALFGSAHAEDTGRGRRFTDGWLFGAAWLFPGMCWMWFLTIPGYLAAATLFAALHGAAAAVAPARGPWRVIGRPAAHTVAEAIRFCTPFGGVPLASLPIGQAAGPFAGVARVGGAVLLTWFVFQVGFSLTGPSPYVPRIAGRLRSAARPCWHGVIALAVALGVWAVAPLATGQFGQDVKAAAPLRIAAVQGGGPQGTHAIDTSAAEVLARHLAATATLQPGDADVVVWPENVVDTNEVPFDKSPQLAAIAQQAARLQVPFVVGITEDTPDGNHFLNAQVVVSPEGKVVGSYEKVRRVPFGEYMPMRGLLRALGAPTDLVPRDAQAGTGPAVLDLPDGTRLAVVISWEVFFGGRANEGVAHGGSIIVNPTNGSSYTWTVLQSQQIAASRLRAIEQHRPVVQVSPTGFSAFVTADGDVSQRTSVSEQKVIVADVQPQWGRTWYSRLGNLPWVALAALTLLASILLARRSDPPASATGRESESAASRR